MPLFPKHPPAFRERVWPPVFKPNAPGKLWPKNLAKFLRGALRLEPGQRITMQESQWHDLFQPRRLQVILAAVPAEQGAASVAQEDMDPRLLEWLQADSA